MSEPRANTVAQVRYLPYLDRWWPFLLIGPIVFVIRLQSTGDRAAPWILLVIGVAFVVQLVGRRRQIVLTRETALLGGFVVWAALSLAWSPDAAQGFRFVAAMAIAFLAFSWGQVSGAPGGAARLWWVGGIGLGLALAGLALVPDPPPLESLNPDRILAMGVIALLVASWYGPRTRWYTAAAGLVALATVVASGSRMASLVVVVLLVTAPGLRLPRAGRVLLAVMLMAATGFAATTSAFQERWFESGEGTIVDLLTLDALQSSGRFEVWPVVADSCGFTLLGRGVGAADSYSSTTNAGFPEPHNEYLRVWCDTGLFGSLMLWGFVASIAVEAARTARQRRARPWAHHAALQMVVALVLLSLTDNPLTTVLPFLAPALLALGWASGEAILNGPGPPRNARRHPAGGPGSGGP